MTAEELKKWEYLIRKYPERAGVAYELYVNHKTKDANPTTYFMWAGKLEMQEERRYRKGMKKYVERQIMKMEFDNGE